MGCINSKEKITQPSHENRKKPKSNATHRERKVKQSGAFFVRKRYLDKPSVLNPLIPANSALPTKKPSQLGHVTSSFFSTSIHTITQQQTSYQKYLHTKRVATLNCQFLKNGQWELTLVNIHGKSKFMNLNSQQNELMNFVAFNSDREQQVCEENIKSVLSQPKELWAQAFLDELHQHKLRVMNTETEQFSWLKIKNMKLITEDASVNETTQAGSPSSMLISFLVEFETKKDFTQLVTINSLCKNTSSLVNQLKTTLLTLEDIFLIEQSQAISLNKEKLSGLYKQARNIQYQFEVLALDERTSTPVANALTPLIYSTANNPMFTQPQRSSDPRKILKDYCEIIKQQFITFHATLTFTFQTGLSNQAETWTAILSDFKGSDVYEFFGQSIPRQIALKDFIPFSLQSIHERKVWDLLTGNGHDKSDWDNLFLGMLQRQQLSMKHPLTSEQLKVNLEIHPDLEKNLNVQKTHCYYFNLMFNVPKAQPLQESNFFLQEREFKQVFAHMDQTVRALNLDFIEIKATVIVLANELPPPHPSPLPQGGEGISGAEINKNNLTALCLIEQLTDNIDLVIDSIKRLMRTEEALFSAQPHCRSEYVTFHLPENKSAFDSDDDDEKVSFQFELGQFLTQFSISNDCNVTAELLDGEAFFLLKQDFDNHIHLLKKCLMEAVLADATSVDIKCNIDLQKMKIAYLIDDNRKDHEHQSVSTFRI